MIIIQIYFDYIAELVLQILPVKLKTIIKYYKSLVHEFFSYSLVVFNNYPIFIAIIKMSTLTNHLIKKFAIITKNFAVTTLITNL